MHPPYPQATPPYLPVLEGIVPAPTESPPSQAIVTAQRVCGVAVALFFLCFLLSGSGGGLTRNSSAAPGKRRQISGGSEQDGSWQFFGAQQRPAAPAKTLLGWEEARAWVRQGLELLASADEAQGWQAVADPLIALRDDAFSDEADSPRRRRQLLGSYRTTVHGWLLRWGGLHTGRRRRLGEGAAHGAGDVAQGVDPDSLDVPPEDADEAAEEAAADGLPHGRPPTALVVVPTANVWNMTAALISTLEMCRDRFELLVRDRRCRS